LPVEFPNGLQNGERVISDNKQSVEKLFGAFNWLLPHLEEDLMNEGRSGGLFFGVHGSGSFRLEKLLGMLPL
jgi:hypothetical protein